MNSLRIIFLHFKKYKFIGKYYKGYMFVFISIRSASVFKKNHMRVSSSVE